MMINVPRPMMTTPSTTTISDCAATAVTALTAVTTLTGWYGKSFSPYNCSLTLLILSEQTYDL